MFYVYNLKHMTFGWQNIDKQGQFWPVHYNGSFARICLKRENTFYEAT
jgi:hypothetical protein